MIGMHSGLMLAAVLTMGGGRPADSIATIAGSYHFFDGRPSPRFRLDVTAEGRFAVYSMNLAVIEENRGGAEVRDGRLILTPEHPYADLKAKGFSTKLTPIHWGERLVLVPEGRERAFCNLANLGLSETSLRGVVYIREGDERSDTLASGRPDVPPEWSPMLLKAPIEGRVVEALSDLRARVDFGSDRGAMEGLNVWVVSHSVGGAAGLGWQVGTVVEVARASCVIELKAPVYDEVRFKVGQRILTRHPFADVARARPAAGAPKADQSSTP
jgi:hypothetical protein